MNDSPYAPYAPPQHQHQHQPQGPYGGGYVPFVYKPLGWLTTATIVGIIGTVVLGFLQTGTSLAFPDVLKHPAPENLGIILALGVIGLATSVVSIATWVLFLVWTNLAAKNVRAFGQEGLSYTPGWCVGWWFVPIMSLYKPFDALREVWKASDPETVGPYATKPWMASTVPAALLVWWGVYISNGFVSIIIALSNLDLSGKKPAVTVGPANLLTHALLGVAGIFLIMIMRELAKRQEASWQRLSSAPAQAASPMPYAPAVQGHSSPPANPYL
jgi:hypothetical protein